MKSNPRTILALALKAALISTVIAGAAKAAQPVIPLASLNGSNGFRLDGATVRDYSGGAVSNAGDVNGDGIDDLIIGASGADPNSIGSGSSYVVFGRSAGGFASTINLPTLDGSNGFRLDGVAQFDRSGGSVSAAGDINGDGIDDLIVGTEGASPATSHVGSSYVVFGRSAGGFTSTINLSTLDGSNGFRLDGVAEFDTSGSAVSAAGDLNGDGVDDLVIGAGGAGSNGAYSGSSYVVFGRPAGGFASVIKLSTLDGSNGFRLDGVAATDFSGSAVSAAGDINGDGVDDLITGAYGADANGTDSGSSYVIFGLSAGGFAATINLSTLDGSNGFRLDGVAEGDFSGRAVSAAGDINGDGMDDLIIGAIGADPNGDFSGSSYVVFGRSAGGFASAINLATLDGSNGFRLDGAAAQDRSGAAVSAAGDMNGDGVDDLIVGAPFTEPNGPRSGSSYVVYGRLAGGFASAINLSTLDGSNGFRLDGVAAEDSSGFSVSAAGDMNADGIDDAVVGASRADSNGSDSGSSYVVFGARDRIFRDGTEDTNIDEFYPRLDVRTGFLGSGVKWSNGATCNCDDAPFDFNIYRSGADMAFFWPVAGTQGGIASGGVYSVLQPGAIIDGTMEFSIDLNPPATANWRAGTTGYLGFRFTSPNSGFINYGYALIETSAPNGYPAKIVRFGVNLTGLPVTIPAQ